jgi:uncharacterized membrane protein YcjF (UPF0283 family)
MLNSEHLSEAVRWRLLLKFASVIFSQQWIFNQTQVQNKIAWIIFYVAALQQILTVSTKVNVDFFFYSLESRQLTSFSELF